MEEGATERRGRIESWREKVRKQEREEIVRWRKRIRDCTTEEKTHERWRQQKHEKAC